MASPTSKLIHAASSTNRAVTKAWSKRLRDDSDEEHSTCDSAANVPTTPSPQHSSTRQLPSPESLQGTSPPCGAKIGSTYASKRPKLCAPTEDESRYREHHELFGDVCGNVTMQEIDWNQALRPSMKSQAFVPASRIRISSSGLGRTPDESASWVRDATTSSIERDGRCDAQASPSIKDEPIPNDDGDSVQAPHAMIEAVQSSVSTSDDITTMLEESEHQPREDLNDVPETSRQQDQATDSLPEPGGGDMDQARSDHDDHDDDNDSIGSDGSTDTEDVHNIHCGSSDCEECAVRGPGIHPWKVDQVGVDDLHYTPGVTGFARTYDGRNNVLAMVISRNFMERIRYSVEEARNYRTVKTEIEARACELQHNNQSTLEAYRHAKQAWTTAKRDLVLQRHKPSQHQKELVQTLRNEYDDASHAYHTFINDRRRLQQQAVELDRGWLEIMREVSYEHEALLVESGVIPMSSTMLWTDQEYSWSNILNPKEDHTGDDNGSDASAAFTDDNQLPQSSDSDSRDEPNRNNDDLQTPLERCQKRVQECKVDFRCAYEKHEFMRYEYDYRFNNYVAEHPGHSQDSLAQRFGPEYFAQWKQGIQDFQAADDALVKVKEEREVLRATCPAEQEKKAEKVMLEEDIIAAECGRAIEEVNRDRIFTWMKSFPEEMDSATLSKEETAKLWKKPLYRLVAQPTEDEEAQDGVNHIEADEDDEAKDGVSDVEAVEVPEVVADSAKDTNLFKIDAVAISDVRDPPHRSRGHFATTNIANIESPNTTKIDQRSSHGNAGGADHTTSEDHMPKLRTRIRKETNDSPMFGWHDMSDMPNVGATSADAVSTYEDYQPARRDIDKWARKVRGGYY